MTGRTLQGELQVGGAVPPDKVYIVRHTDAELLGALENGEYCNVLCPRQMGKTSAIVRIRTRLRNEGCRTALIDIAGRLGTPATADDWYLGLLREISYQCQLGCDVKAWWAASSEPTPNQRLLAFFREQMLGRVPQRFIVFLDEIDHTINLTYTDDFFVAIRSLYNDRAAEPDLQRLAFCLVGVFTPNELVKQQRTTSYNIGRTFELEDFDSKRDDLSQFVRILSADPSTGGELLRAVLRWTGGQPYLTVSACKKVAAAGVHSPKAVSRLIKDLFLTYEKSIEDSDGTHFENISRFLGQRVTSRIETAELYRRILRGSREPESSTPAVAALKLSGLVKADRNGRLVVRNEIYRRRFDADWAMAVLSLGEPAIRSQAPEAESAPPLSGQLVQHGTTPEQFHKALSSIPEPARPSTGAIFITHCSQDDDIVRGLRRVFGELGEQLWIDSRELRGGDQLWPEVQRAMEAASAYAIVVSVDALQSRWVGKELRHALEIQKRRGKDVFPIIPLSLSGTKLGVLEEFFTDEPLYVPILRGAGGIEAGVGAILVALGKRLPSDPPMVSPPPVEPLEELVLELTDLKFHEENGVRRASACARLIYEPASADQLVVVSQRSWRLVAPLGPIEAEELRWYLEKYAIWPSKYFQDRARKVEASLVEWGQRLHREALPAAQTENVMKAWAKIGDHAERRFSVYVDTGQDADAPDIGVKTAREAAALLLGLPWELLHDGKAYLFQGAKPMRVRRRLPNTRVLDVPVSATPIRILLVTARPEDDTCSYFDHRSSALPLVEAMESLPGLVKIHVLNPATLPALREELDRARRTGAGYHVVHFDGHGVYDKAVGLGGLCFEHPEDIGELQERRHVTVFTSEFGPILRDHRVPLVFLDACVNAQTAQVEKASESTASDLLKGGVASVVAMSHSVLVETSRRFVESFYKALARGKRVGDAMLAGQRQLKGDSFRGRIFGAGELRLEDWFVPVLFQEKDDPRLFRTASPRETQEDFKNALATRLGELPMEPETGFIGRSRELLALERLFRLDRYALVRGQGGEGKTALAAEFVRWMVRSHQVRRAAFVSVETHSNVAAALDAIGRQLVPGYSVGASDELDQAILLVERALREQSTLLLVDGIESILLPPYLETPGALSEEAGRELTAILALCERLLKVGDTRLVFTSREALPAPFDDEKHRLELHRLECDDAVKLVERSLNAVGAAGAGATLDASRESIETLVEAVHGHARTLALLAPELRSRGVEGTRAALVDLIATMEQQFPGSREHSLFATAELSLRRLSPANRDKARVLGVFHGAADLDVLRVMMRWEREDVGALADELIATGLATPNRYNHFTLNPALCPFLRARMEAAERKALTARWVEAMRAYVDFLTEQQSQNTQVAATLTVLELPNLFALLDLVQRAGDAEVTIEVATSLYSLLQYAGKPRLLERVGQVRDAAAAALGDDWNHARFQATRTRIEQQLAGGRMREALEGAQQLLQRATAAAVEAYPGADYDLAMAQFILARVLKTAGVSEQALPLLDESRQRFEAVAKENPGKGAERMAGYCLTERGDCLLHLGRLDEAEAAYEESIRRAEELGDQRQVAVTKGQVGSVRMQQGRYREALAVLEEAREWFTRLNEPGSVAAVWHQTGMVYQLVGQPEAAEDAYRKSLAIDVRLGDVAGQAATLGQLGNLYDDVRNRPEEAVAFLRQAADKYSELHNVVGEARTRSNLAATLLKLRRVNEARQEIRRAIDGREALGHAGSIWNAWAVLANIETAAGNPPAAAEAKQQAITSYLAYRRDGGENHYAPGRLSLAVTQDLLANDADSATPLLQQVSDGPNATGPMRTFIRALQAIVAGSRDRALADAPELDHMMAAEILLLIDTLENPQRREKAI